MFPKMWSDFVGCTKSFAASCISSTELSQFNRAVGNSINSVHKMCTNEDYQKGKDLKVKSMEKKRLDLETLMSFLSCRLPQKCNMHQKRSHRRKGLQVFLRRVNARDQQSFRIRNFMLVCILQIFSKTCQIKGNNLI